jgi:carbonic anhydrase
MELAQGQEPFAAIVSCSDSRVPTDTVFDQSPGDIFGIRVAGNSVDDIGLGSVEYSVAVLKSSLILVLGHTHCGAAKAAVQFVKDGTTQPGHIADFVAALAPAAKATKGMSGDWAENTAVQNVRDVVASLPTRSTIIADALKANKVRIAGAIYDLHTGKVSVVH